MPEKYQEEIEEILKGIEEKSPITPTREPSRPRHQPQEPAGVRQRPFQPRYSYGRRWPSLSPSKLGLAGVIFILAGWLSPIKFLIWVGLGLLVGTYLLLFIRPRSIYVEKRWRGQAMEPGYSPWERFKRWLKN